MALAGPQSDQTAQKAHVHTALTAELVIDFDVIHVTASHKFRVQNCLTLLKRLSL